jgi:hypothetical protein
MFEQIFDEYRKAVESSFQLQQEMYREWMNGWPIKPPVAEALTRGAAKDQVHAYQRKWSEMLSETLEKHREALNAQYQSGIEAIQSAFQTSEAKTPEEYWRLTQEFWRKSIDSYKSAFETQGKYLQGLAEMWLEMVTRGKV